MARQTIYGQEGGTGPTALSTIDGILKEDYVVNNIIDTVNMSTYLLSRMGMERTTAGRRFILPYRFGVGEGQGMRAENSDLPDEGFGEYDQAMGNVKYQYGKLYISGPAIEATEGGRATFASALKQSLKDTRDGYKLETYRQQWADGAGTMGLVNGAVAASTTVPVKDPLGLTYTLAALENSQRTRPYRKNMVLLFKTSGVTRKVVGINGDGSIEVDSAVTLVDGERIIRGDSTTLSNDGIEYLGVNGAIQATGTYLTIARASNPEWQGNLIDLGGSPLDEDMMQYAFDTAEIQGDGMSEPDLLISEHRVRRLYVALLQADRRFMNPMQLTGGFSALEYNGKPWVVDKLCPPQRIYYLTTADWLWYVMKNIGWLNRDGTVLKWVDNKDAYVAVLRAYREFVCKKPANQTVLYGVTS